jgi:hypothetical protein
MDGEFKSYLFIDVRSHDDYAQAQHSASKSRR